MDKTAPDPLQTAAALTALQLTLTVAYHPDERYLGARRAVGEPLELGRGGGVLGPGVLDDELLSRRHARVERRDGALLVSDLGSRNGTFVDGHRVHGSSPLAEGALLALGSMILVAGRGPATRVTLNDPLLKGCSLALKQVLDDVHAVAAQDVTVLVRGETGVGKELVARRIHELSGRRGPFVAVNCGGLVDGVVASELFGHAAGAFSGAGKERGGLVEAASGGTLLFDEIGDASPQLQVSLLRLLQDRRYRPVGANESRGSDARFVAATHVRLDDAVAAGAFRRDLLARLRRWVIDVAPLRDRREDIMPIALHLARQRLGKEARIDRALATALVAHPWPDNVRGLAAMIDNAALDVQGAELTLTARVRERLQELANAPDPQLQEANGDGEEVARFRKERPDAAYLTRRLKALDLNVKALAAELGVSRTTLYRWLKGAGIDPQALRRSG